MDEKPGVGLDKVKLEHIGAGGLKGDKNFVEVLEGHIHAVGPKVLDPDCDGKATITAKIQIKAGPNGLVLLSSGFTVAEPKLKQIGLAAFMDESQHGLVTQQHRQEALAMPINVTNMDPRAAAGGKEKK